MKLSARDVPAFFANPDAKAAGVLIYGADAMRVALRRKDMLTKLLGPQAEDEMRLTRMLGTDVRKDGAGVLDAIKAVGFFPGPRAALIEDANDTAAAAVIAGLEDWQAGDAQLIVTAGNLKPTSKIRKAFEQHKTAYAIAIYNEPPSRAEIEQVFAKAGLGPVDDAAGNALGAYARDLDPGDFAQFIEKLALYTMGKDTPVNMDDIAACAPASIEAALDDVINAVAESRTQDLPQIFQRLSAQGVNATGLCIAALRHFKTLHTAASDPGGVSQGMQRMRPPIYGPRRDRLQRQAQTWGRVKLEQGMSVLLETDLKLRSAGQTAPQMAVMERSLIRLAMLGRR